MGRFLIFFKYGQDQGLTVDGISNQAEACQSATGKNFGIRRVEVSAAGDPDLVHWSKLATIECVTVVDDKVKDRATNPPPYRIGVMVRNLP